MSMATRTPTMNDFDEQALWAAVDEHTMQYTFNYGAMDDDALIFPEVNLSLFDADAALRDLFGGDIDLESLLAQPANATEPTAYSSISSPLAQTLTRASTEALRVLDPTLRIPEEVLPLGEEPSVQLLPRGRSLHQYEPDLYRLGSSTLSESKATYDSSNQANGQPEANSADVTPRKRKASTSLAGVAKTRKTASGGAFPPLSGVSYITTTTPPAASDYNEHITSKMQQQAPQARFTAGGPPPQSAPAYQMALPHNSASFFSTKKNPNYNELSKERPPPNVCLPLDTDISVAEFTTFFPNALQIPLVTTRLMRNGFSNQTIAKMQLDPVNELTEKAADTVEQKLKWQNKHAGQAEWSHLVDPNRTMWTQIAKGLGPHHDLTANHLKQRHEYPAWDEVHPWGHCKLSDIYEPVDDAKWPQGQDRMVITQCLEFAKNNPQLDLDTSHWNWIIQAIDAKPPPFPAGYITRDAEAAARYASVYPTRQALAMARKATKAKSKK